MTEETEEKIKEFNNTEDQFAEEAAPVEKSAFGTKMLAPAAILLLFIIFAGVFYYLQSGAADDAEKKEEPVVSVKATMAERTSISSEISASGTVAPAEQSTLSSTISAQIVQMRILKNAFVQKGEILAVLASQDLRAQRDEAQSALNEAKLNLETLQKVTIPQTEAQTEKEISDAKANLDNVRATYERRNDLYKKGGISLKELEASQLAMKNAENAFRLIQQNAKLNINAVNPITRSVAEAKIKQAQDRLRSIQAQANFAEIRAPISGVVTDQFQFEGEFASSGAKLLTIANISEVIVKAQFADTVIATLNNGDAVSVYPANAPEERMTGKVTLISRSSDPQTRTVEVWARLGNPRGLLIAGGAARFVVTNQTENNAVVVPLTAVTLDTSNSDEGTVMIVGADSLAHERKVKIGIKHGENVQIVEGLNGGETVVTEGNYALPDGTKVEIAKEEETQSNEK